MQKIVIDTNVLVSSFIQRGYPYLIVDLFFEQKIKLCISDEVIEEYYNVLNREKFSKYPDFLLRAELLLADIETKAARFTPKLKVRMISDRNDNKFLELAGESKANFLITGNTNDFTMAAYRKTKIVTPKEYLEKYSPS